LGAVTDDNLPPLVYQSLIATHGETAAETFFVKLVEEFYLGVANDPVLRPLYPEDLLPARERLVDFLVQYWGGPTRYEETRGHPRLRMRHAKWVIGQDERDRWMQCMGDAVRRSAEVTNLDPTLLDALLTYFDDASTFLINDWQHGQIGRNTANPTT
jgi:hemoglobin